MVLDLDHPRRCPRGAFCLAAFGPRPYGAPQDHLGAARLDGDPAGVDLGAAAERFLDLALDLGR
jgi:hypothetical protein